MAILAAQQGSCICMLLPAKQRNVETHAAAGCADTVDVGETSYASVLADDLDNDGKMDLVLSTMNGNVYCFHSAASYHPLKAWPTPVSFCRTLHHASVLLCSLTCTA